MYKKYFINNVIFLILSVMTSMSSYAQNWSKELENAAKKGDAEAALLVGNAYICGKEVERDIKKATYFFDVAAQDGNIKAKQLLFSYYNKVLVKYAKEGDDEAQYYLGLSYYNGTEIEKDVECAAQWFEKSMEQGNEKARTMFYSFNSKTRSKRIKEFDVLEQLGISRTTINTYNEHYNGFLFKGEASGKFRTYDSPPSFKGYRPQDGEMTMISKVDTISGLLKGDSILNGVYKRGISNGYDSWDYCGNMTSNFRKIFSHKDSVYIYKLVFTFLKGGHFLFKNANIESGRLKIQGLDVEMTLKEDLKITAGKLDLDDYIERCSGDRYIITPEMELTYNHWTELCGIGSNLHKEYWIPRNTPEENTKAKIRFELEYEYNRLKFRPIGYDIKFPGGSRIVLNMPGVDFAYYPPNSDVPVNILQGCLTSINGTEISWEYVRDCTDGRPFKLKAKEANGDMVCIKANKPSRSIEDIDFLLGIANGHLNIFTGSIKNFGSDYIIDWRVDHDAQGTYTYASGKEERIINGCTETEIQAEKDRLAEQEWIKEEKAAAEAEEEWRIKEEVPEKNNAIKLLCSKQYKAPNMKVNVSGVVVERNPVGFGGKTAPAVMKVYDFGTKGKTIALYVYVDLKDGTEPQAMCFSTSGRNLRLYSQKESGGTVYGPSNNLPFALLKTNVKGKIVWLAMLQGGALVSNIYEGMSEMALKMALKNSGLALKLVENSAGKKVYVLNGVKMDKRYYGFGENQYNYQVEGEEWGRFYFTNNKLTKWYFYQ